MPRILPIVVAHVGEHKCELFLDSDSTINIVSADTDMYYLQEKFKDIQGPTNLIQGVSKVKVQTLGEVITIFSLLGRQFTDHFVVMQANYFPAHML